MKIAIVGGTAGLGFGLALRLAKAGEEVLIGSRNPEKAVAAADEVVSRVGGGDVHGGANADVVQGAEVVIVTVPYPGLAPTYNGLKDVIDEGATVIDCNVPLASEIGGKPTRMIGVWEGSAAQQARSLLPRSINVASGFHTVMFSRLEMVDTPLDQDVLVCGDKEGRAVAEKVVGKIEGARFIDCGPIETARILESLTALLIRININYKLDPGAGLKVTGL